MIGGDRVGKLETVPILWCGSADMELGERATLDCRMSVLRRRCAQGLHTGG